MHRLLLIWAVQGIGCAGFNTVLGPVRGQMRALTLLWLFALWGAQLYVLEQKRRWDLRQLALSSALALLLMYLPELLLWSSPDGVGGIAPPTEGAISVPILVSGMGCEACQAHVSSVLHGAAGIVGATVDFEKGTAMLSVAKGWAYNLTEISAKLEAGGYSVTEIQVSETPSRGAGMAPRQDKPEL